VYSPQHHSASEGTMRLPIYALVCVLGLSVVPAARQVGTAPVQKSQRLETLTWQEAEPVLTPETVVLIPLGAASKEHGPHLKLRNDLTLAEYLTQRVGDATPVVVAPALTYHFYPAFLEYPGSTSLSLATSRDMTAEVVRTLAAYGPRRFYVLNTGVSTLRALEPAAAMLASEGVLMRYTNLATKLDPAIKSFSEQEGGTHADEVETSMMLYIDPASVDMKKAVKDYTPAPGGGRLTRQRGGTGTYSPTGTWGDPTRATREKGRVFVEALVAGMVEDIGALRTASLPARSAATPPAAEPPRPTAAPRPADATPNLPERCSPGDERDIMNIGNAFATHWANADSVKLGALWSRSGDIIHPDGAIERGSQLITINRAQLFARREYRNTRHPMTLTMIRCLANDIAVADGKWELRGVLDSSGKPLPTMEGQVTLVLKRTGGWLIEAYRYTIKPPAAPQTTPAPLPKRPGGGVTASSRPPGTTP
jgi:creatinine amidohydrolase